MTLARPIILQIIPELATGGAELTTVEITAAIVRAGGVAMVATSGGRMVADLKAAGGEFVPMAAASKNPATILANARRLARIARERGIDLIHARSRAPAWSARLAARMAGVPFVTTYHGAYNEGGYLKRAYNAVMASGDIVIANSDYTARLVTARYRTEPERLCVVPRGVDVDRFDPAKMSSDRIVRLREAWRINGQDRVILQAARLTAWKGQRVAIAAMERLAVGDGPGKGILVLAGDEQGRDAYRRELADTIAATGLAERVRLVGHCADMPAAFALAHVALVASTEPEAFGRTATEAQAMGCPVIATDIGAPPETVLAFGRAGTDAATGWLVPPSEPSALAAALDEALALSPEHRAIIGARARRHVLARFTLSEMQRRTMAVYDALIGSNLETAFLKTADH